MIYGYVRVSSRDQNVRRQLMAMHEFCVKQKDIFIDKQSGKDFDRPQWQRLMECVEKGDVIVISSIDRLGRNYTEILDQWRILTREKQVDVVILDMPLLDTRDKDSDLTGRFIADLVLQILSYVAETERTNIRKRQAEGISAARSRGVHCGRAYTDEPDAFGDIYAQWQNGVISMREGARLLQLSYTTFRRMVRRRRRAEALTVR